MKTKKTTLLAGFILLVVISGVRASEKAESPSLFKQASDLYHQRQYEKAIAQYQLVLSDKKTSSTEIAQSHFDLSVCYYRIKKYQKALDQLDEYLDTDNLLLRKDMNARLFYAQIAIDKKDFTQAREMLESALTQKKITEQSRAGIVYMIGESYRLEKKYDKAVKYYQKVETMKKGRPGTRANALFHKANIYKQTNKLNEAVEAYQQLIAEFSTTATNTVGWSLYRMGDIFVKQGKTEKAKEALGKIKDIPKMNASIIKAAQAYLNQL